MKNNNRKDGIYHVTFVGGMVNVLLLVVKFVSGIVGNSTAMIADAVHSLSDFVTDLIVLVFVHISCRPEDQHHQYGHGKFETLATVIVGVILLGVGTGICWEGMHKIYSYLQGEALVAPSMLALWAALGSVFLKECLYHYTLRVGKRLRSDLVIANAWHHRSDAFSSIGTAVGIGGAILLGPDWRVLDPIAAVLVSFFILKVAMHLLKDSLGELLEESLPEEVNVEICSIVKSFPDVQDPHHLRTRCVGNRYAIEMHIRMRGDITLEQAHSRVNLIEDAIKQKYGRDTLISIHVEPIGGEGTAPKELKD